MADRLISANALKELIAKHVYPVADVFNNRDNGMFWTGGIEKAIDDTPTVDAEPIKHGYWTNIKVSATGNSSAECSLCGTVVHDTFADTNRINYCPHCGAKMDESTTSQL